MFERLNARVLIQFMGTIISTGLILQCEPIPPPPELTYDTEVLSQVLSSHHEGVYFIDEAIGYVVSYNGVIIKTSDGGQTWELQNSGTTKPLFDVFFLDEDIGYAAGGCSGTQCGGAESILLKTTDGGTAWTKLSVPAEIKILSTYFLDEMTGFAAGLGPFLSTTDGGETWSIRECDGGSARSICFANQQVGYVILPQGRLLKTLDGGKIWTEVEIGDISIFSLFFVDSDVGYAAGRSINKTTNGGYAWSQLNDKPVQTYAVYFIDHDRGFAVGRAGWSGGDFGHTYGAIYTTADGGHTWESDADIDAMHCIHDVHFPSAKVGYAVGSGSNILKITVLD
jgi:photosystem II stability/assembly factor-like uncharacterized protein